MPNKPIKFSLNLGKIPKELIVEKNGVKYLNCVVWPNKNGPDNWGNTHGIKIDLTKEQNEQGVQSPFIGNMKVPDEGYDQRPPDRRPAPPVNRPKPPVDVDLDETGCPF